MEEGRWLLLNLLKMWGSLILSFGLIFFFVAPNLWFHLMVGLLGVSAVLFVGGYILAKKSSEKRSS